jgi:hypothetical protein
VSGSGGVLAHKGRGGECELLGCDVLLSVSNFTTFRNNLLSPCSGQKLEVVGSSGTLLNYMRLHDVTLQQIVGLSIELRKRDGGGGGVVSICSPCSFSNILLNTY